jgi:mono/diheme cytochrome c family protein
MRSIGLNAWRHCFGVLVTVFVGLILIGCSGSDSPPSEISSAVRAPYIAVASHDTSALCADFTPLAASRLARDVSQSANCEERVAEAFARSAPFEPKSQPVAPNDFKVSGVTQHGNVASAVVTYGVGGSGVRVTLELARIGGAWRISSQPALRLVSGCYVGGVLTANCPKNARVALFSIGRLKLLGEPGGGVNGQQLVPVPPAVEDAGGRELSEFNAGMKVVAQTGCLACHRIGEQGNSGPGPDLTHVGSRLSAEQIEHAILDPTAPMPSFRNLPREKLAAVVEFLSQVKSNAP